MTDELVRALERAGADSATSAALVRALRDTGRPGERPEDHLPDVGIVSGQALAFELARASGLQYCGLRGFAPDPRLFLYVPLQLALRERVCPLVIVGDSLKLASAFLDPDLSVVRERFPRLELELVIAPRDDVLAALGHVASGI